MTNIPEDAVKAAENIVYGIVQGSAEKRVIINRIAITLMEARDKALEDARLVVTGWRERDYPEGFHRLSAEQLAICLAMDIDAMKSTRDVKEE